MKIKTYKVEFYQDENNNLHCERENDGFNSLEILGMLEETKIQIIRLMNGEIKIPIENTKITSVSKDRITIDYVIKNCDISERLKSALNSYMDSYEVIYIDEVDATLMRKRIRNVGRFTEHQLIELKEKLLNK
jgi:hypothetical protein